MSHPCERIFPALLRRRNPSATCRLNAVAWYFEAMKMICVAGAVGGAPRTRRVAGCSRICRLKSARNCWKNFAMLDCSRRWTSTVRLRSLCFSQDHIVVLINVSEPMVKEN